jgi:methionyl-tRNA formyltransferase
MQEKCILITDADHYLVPDALTLCRAHFGHVAVIDENDAAIEDGRLASETCDLLISFLNEHILPPELLKFTNINFHPAPPQYPGRGGASYALFEGVTTYGATAHVMAGRVDAGPIILASEFPIDPDECCETLFAKAERSSLDLLVSILATYSKTGKLPPANGMQWGRRPGTRKQFDKWLILDSLDRTTFDRKIVAAHHSRFPGPYIFVHGLKFALVNDESNRTAVRKMRKGQRPAK